MADQQFEIAVAIQFAQCDRDHVRLLNPLPMAQAAVSIVPKDVNSPRAQPSSKRVPVRLAERLADFSAFVSSRSIRWNEVLGVCPAERFECAVAISSDGGVIVAQRMTEFGTESILLVGGHWHVAARDWDSNSRSIKPHPPEPMDGARACLEAGMDYFADVAKQGSEVDPKEHWPKVAEGVGGEHSATRVGEDETQRVSPRAKSTRRKN